MFRVRQRSEFAIIFIDSLPSTHLLSLMISCMDVSLSGSADCTLVDTQLCDDVEIGGEQHNDGRH